MARYKVLAKSFINNSIVNPGDEVEYDGVPGKALEPVDEAAKAAAAKKAKADAAKKPATTEPSRLDPDVRKHEVEIPDGWEDLRPPEIVALSRKLGAPNNNSPTQALAFIEKEVDRRAAAKE